MTANPYYAGAYLKPELLGDPGNLVGRQHDAESKQHITGEGEKPQKQKRCLHERRQTDRRHLLHPLIEAVRIAPRYAEHIQCAYRHLHEQNAAALDVLKKDFDHAVGKCDHCQNIEQVDLDII